jgi:hypothetical protein
MRAMRFVNFVMAILIFQVMPCLGQVSTYAVIVSSASGNAEFKAKFWDWSSQMTRTLADEMKIPKNQIYFLTEDPNTDLSLSTGKATKAEMTKVLQTVESRVKPGDRVFLLLLGHGSFDGSDYKFNLVGPDMTGSELNSWLGRFGQQQIVVVNTTPCSGILTKTLSAKNRVVVTATKSEFENNDTIFAQFFVEAFKDKKADLDKNKQVSLLEAYVYAAQRVEAWYKDQGRLATEHPLLEDNGDKTGTARPSPANGEGLLAGKISLTEGVGVAAAAQTGTPASPEFQSLMASKNQLEAAIQDLKYKKDSLSEAEYSKQLESLLIRLAQTNQKMSALQKQ